LDLHSPWNFGQANWTNYEFLAQILENPRSLKKLPLEATEAILAFVAKAIEFLDPCLAQVFLPGCLAVMELMVEYDKPVARPSDQFISNVLMIDKHLEAIFGYMFRPDSKEVNEVCPNLQVSFSAWLQAQKVVVIIYSQHMYAHWLDIIVPAHCEFFFILGWLTISELH
jgi:hypothetical protein